MQIRLILLDFDGTLADTRRANTLAYVATLREAGYALTEEEYAAKYFGMRCNEFLTRYGIADPAERERLRLRKIALYPAFFDTVRLNRPLWEFCRQFRAQGGRVWIVSTGSRANIDNAMRHLGITVAGQRTGSTGAATSGAAGRDLTGADEAWLRTAGTATIDAGTPTHATVTPEPGEGPNAEQREKGRDHPARLPRAKVGEGDLALGEQREDLKEIVVGTNSKERGYPAIFQLKSLKVPAYQVVAGAEFNSNSLWPLSSRFKGAEAKARRIERSVDKYGNDMYPYFQVLRADDLVPGTQVISKSAPRQIRGMIGAGDYKWSDGADALYPMDAWIELAQANNIPVTVLGQAPGTSPSATTAPPPVSASPSAAPTTATPSGTPSVSAQPTDQPVPPVNHGDNGWSMIALGTAVVLVLIGLIGICWLLMLRRRKKTAQPAEDNAPQDES